MTRKTRPAARFALLTLLALAPAPGARAAVPAVGGGAPPVLTAKSPVRVWVDQIGYRAAGRKVVIVAADAPLPAKFDAALCDAAGGASVWTAAGRHGAYTLWNGGKKDDESGEFVAHLDLSDFKKPGRYYLAYEAGGGKLRSFAFTIADDVYHDAGLASWKAMYYQRADTEKPEKFAGPWNHKLDHHGPSQATEARVYKWNGKSPHFEPLTREVIDPAPRDVTGGWWDAGDFNKYAGNTTLAHDDLLLGYQLLGGAGRDGQLRIPESGNRVPDELDEIRYCTEFLLRLADEEGAAFGRVHEDGTSPPDADKNPVQLTQPASGATMNRAAALAYAALVWKESKLDDAFARKCLDGSMKSWKLLEQKPHPWPADPNDAAKPAPTGEWFFADFKKTKALAAACYFALTGEKAYDALVHELTAEWKTPAPGEATETYPVVWVYSRAAGADGELAKRLKGLILASADASVKQTGAGRGYGAGVRGYWWGSNRLVAANGFNCVLAAQFTDDATAKQKYLAAAEEYVHYLLGRNPVGLCYLSNMKSFGAENSAMVMFHSWVGKDGDKNSAPYVGDGPGKIGPFPGMVVGGANGGMKRYVSVLDWRQSPWEFSEPDITYQSPCASLLGYFALKVK